MHEKIYSRSLKMRACANHIYAMKVEIKSKGVNRGEGRYFASSKVTRKYKFF